MEINQDHFRQQLLPVLRSIAKATFVSFDLEMSGISTRPKFSAGDRSHDVGKPSLQKQYDDMRNAAETFQVLQFGITCVEEDRDKEFYLARPYNFNLTPLSAEGVDLRLDRQFTFSTSACDFLNKNSFDFGKVFHEGVPYLSRDEEDERREEYAQRASKNAKIPDIVIAADDMSTIDFSRAARKTISDWVKEEKPEYNFVNIGNEAGPMNAFQRRLVHQLVRNEFPTLRTFPRNDGYFMQIEVLDVKKEEEFQKRKSNHFNNLIAKQKGLRWIFEALSGGDLSGIDPEWFYNASSSDAEALSASTKVEFAHLTALLRKKKQIIVGHNLFADLAFLFRTFVGHLPVNVKHFQEDIHALFPTVIDTKYIATLGADAMNPRANLKELLTPFRKTHMPLIVLHEEHTSYCAHFGKEHEAGFDSWMTAELFVKLTASKRLESKTLLPSLDYDSSSSEEDLSSSSPDSSSRGALLFSAFSTPTEEEGVHDHHPPEWHANMLNPPVTYTNSNGADVTPTQWLPSWGNRFWEKYVNKLRVQGSEEGVCDLAEREEDERLDGLRLRQAVV